MAILKLYGWSKATCTQRVATVLHELKVPFELIEVKLAEKEHKSPAYLEKQPFGQIPYIPKANALIEQAAAAEVANFDPSASALVIETVAKAMWGHKADQAIVAEKTAILDNKLDAYNAILGKQRYVAGDELTLADLLFIPCAAQLEIGGSDLMTRKPNVARWYKELVARPSWLAYLDGIKSTGAY
ncbi:glutathione S-transferase [Mycena rebaudengoi]|nr:glutathione S-transferase [Mycena rebaudengoi]